MGSHRSRNSTASIASAKLKEDQKRAELEARCQALKRKQQLAEQKFKLEQEEEHLETEMAVNNARAQVLIEAESILGDQHIHQVQAQVHFQPVASTTQGNFEINQTSTPNVNRDVPLSSNDVPPFVNRHVMRPSVGLNSVNPIDNNSIAPDMSWVQSCLQQQCEMLQTVTSALSMPQPEILSFNGKVTEYWKFVRNFETNVASRVKDDSIKLSYLIQNCKG
jgi:hypothetical protein